MLLGSNPFTVLSYVGGPALLTNASSLFVLSTSNRFARTIDRSRFLATTLGGGTAGAWTEEFTDEIAGVAKRLALTGRALTGFYFAAAMFALATLASIVGAIVAEVAQGAPVEVIVGAAALCGVAGFAGFVTGTVSLVAESRLAIRYLTRESSAALVMAKSLARPQI